MATGAVEQFGIAMTASFVVVDVAAATASGVQLNYMIACLNLKLMLSLNPELITDRHTYEPTYEYKKITTKCVTTITYQLIINDERCSGK